MVRFQVPLPTVTFLIGRIKIGRYVYVKERKTKAYEVGHWSQKKRIETVTIWLATGSVPITSDQTGVPIKTIEDWKSKQWWKDMVESCRNESNDKLDVKLTKVLDKALDGIMDRIENGDLIYDQKTGKMRRGDVKLRDLNTAFNTIIDKRQLIRKLPTKITEASNTEAKLNQLAQQFADFTKKAPPKEKLLEYIDGETVVEEEGEFVIKDS